MPDRADPGMPEALSPLLRNGVAAIAIVIGNLLADIAAPFIDPRIKLR